MVPSLAAALALLAISAAVAPAGVPAGGEAVDPAATATATPTPTPTATPTPIPTGDAPSSTPRGEGPLVVVRLKAGRVLEGRLATANEREVVLDTDDGVRFTIRAPAVAEIREAPRDAPGTAWEADANRTRYLYSPSAFMLRTREAYFSQSELLLSTIAVGATDWLTIGVGGVLPAWALDDGFNVGGLLKFGGQVAPGVHAAATVETLFMPGASSTAGGLAFGTLTFGVPDRHVSVSVGAPILFDEEDLDGMAFSLSAVTRTSPRTALVTENWFFPDSRDDVMLNGVAVRFLGSRMAVDTGLLFLNGNGPVPWLDFTWSY